MNPNQLTCSGASSNIGAGWEIIYGDFDYELQDTERFPDGSFSLISTDPPYNRKAVPLYQKVLTHASRLLEPGGNLLMILPQWALPDIMRMDFGSLRWRWSIVMNQQIGSYPRMLNSHRTIWVTCKLLGWWYQPGGPKDYTPVKDSFENVPPDKSEHEWTQSHSWAEYCLQFAREGGKILDPMVGVGTQGVAAVKAGYPFVGIDADQEQLLRAINNISKACEELNKE